MKKQNLLDRRGFAIIFYSLLSSGECFCIFDMLRSLIPDFCCTCAEAVLTNQCSTALIKLPHWAWSELSIWLVWPVLQLAHSMPWSVEPPVPKYKGSLGRAYLFSSPSLVFHKAQCQGSFHQCDRDEGKILEIKVDDFSILMR